jgi:hypothetical protein
MVENKPASPAVPAPQAAVPAPQAGVPAPQAGVPAPQAVAPAPRAGFPAPPAGPPGLEAGPPAPSPRLAVPPGAASHGRWRFGLTLAALVLGLAGLAASVAGIAAQILPRRFSAAEQQQIMAWESARRWRATPAGKIFPASVDYQLPTFALSYTGELPLTAHRVGIARQASCAAAAEAAAAAVLDRNGCATMLRATYIDATGSLVVTIGVAVMPGATAADASIRALLTPHGLRSGVRPLAFRDTLTAGFGGAQQQFSGAIGRGPYLIMSAAGYSDDRPRVAGSADAYEDEEMTSLANGVADAVGAPLGALPPLPRCPGAPGC